MKKLPMRYAKLLALLAMISLAGTLLGPSLTAGPVAAFLARIEPEALCLLAVHLLVGVGLVLEAWLARNRGREERSAIPGRVAWLYLVAGLFSFGSFGLQFGAAHPLVA